MPSLRELQQKFALALNSSEAGSIAAYINSTGLAPPQRVQLYRNNYQISLREALGAVFPVVRALVGDGFFAFMAHEFVIAHPSVDPNLHRFGRQLPLFLSSFEPAASVAYLPDVAMLEWAWHQAFHAQEAEPLDLAVLGAMAEQDQGNIVFGLHPSVTLAASKHPVVSIWEAHQSESTEAIGEVRLDAGPERFLVQRPGPDVQVVDLDEAEYAFLRALNRGLTLEAACEVTLSDHPDTDVAGVLQRFVVLCTVASCSL
jgi:hypothetical protein